MYDILFSKLDNRIPFTNFEVEYINYINVAPSQPFEILMEFLRDTLTTGVLFFVFQVKDVKKWNECL